ncbi:MAG: chromate transporter [Clostridia bacterium]|nr:chromate transporter [Clostridia bacterium]
METLFLLAELFSRFFLVGLFSVGGGLATLPFLQDMGETTGWFGAAEISNMIAISESTPGPMGINMASYIGYQIAGIPGTILASIGLVTPSVVIIIIISNFLKKFRDSKYVNNAFYGLRAASVGLIAAAFYSVASLALFNSEVFSQTGSFFSAINYKSLILAAAVFVCTKFFKKLHPIFLIILSAVIGILLKF